MTDRYRDRRKPGDVLVKWQVKQTFGTLEDTRERDYWYAYVVDTDGFAFRRHLREDGAPTRWEKIISPSRPKDEVDCLVTAERVLTSSRTLMSKGGHVEIIEDNRRFEDPTPPAPEDPEAVPGEPL